MFTWLLNSDERWRKPLKKKEEAYHHSCADHTRLSEDSSFLSAVFLMLTRDTCKIIIYLFSLLSDSTLFPSFCLMSHSDSILQFSLTFSHYSESTFFSPFNGPGTWLNFVLQLLRIHINAQENFWKSNSVLGASHFLALSLRCLYNWGTCRVWLCVRGLNDVIVCKAKPAFKPLEFVDFLF